MTVYTIDSYFSQYDISTYDTEYHYDELKTQVGIDATLKMKVEYLSEKNGAIISTINIDYGLTQNHFNILSEFWQSSEELSTLSEENQGIIVRRNTFPDYGFSEMTFGEVKALLNPNNEIITCLEDPEGTTVKNGIIINSYRVDYEFSAIAYNTVKEMIGSQNDNLSSLSSVSNQNLTGAMLVIRDIRTHGHTENSFKSVKEVLGL